MKNVKEWLVIGTGLVFLGVQGIVGGPIDDRVTSVVSPYIMAPLGVLVLIRGFIALAPVSDRSRFEKWAVGLSYPAVTLGVLLVALEWIAPAIRERDIRLLAFGLPALAAGAGLIVVGILLRKAVEWAERSQSARRSGPSEE